MVRASGESARSRIAAPASANTVRGGASGCAGSNTLIAVPQASPSGYAECPTSTGPATVRIGAPSTKRIGGSVLTSAASFGDSREKSGSVPFWGLSTQKPATSTSPPPSLTSSSTCRVSASPEASAIWADAVCSGRLDAFSADPARLTVLSGLPSSRTARFPSRAREFVCVACIHTVRAPVRVASATDVPSNANTTDSPFFSDIQW